jgi:hypothetical protein
MNVQGSGTNTHSIPQKPKWTGSLCPSDNKTDFQEDGMTTTEYHKHV